MYSYDNNVWLASVKYVQDMVEQVYEEKKNAKTLMEAQF